jgi:antitoxin component YwqK of YwqJK toxin-antitoxin module
MQKIFVTGVLLLAALQNYSQPAYIYIDPITIQPDGTCKRFTYNDGTYHSENVTTGLRLTFWDSSFKQIRTQVYISNWKMNGTYKRFNEKGFLVEMCTFKDGQEDGLYYYWNDEGVLVRKEFYKNGVLKKKMKVK